MKKGGFILFGISDFSISLAYLLCILSTILCVVYGIINWNKGHDDEVQESKVEVSE